MWHRLLLFLRIRNRLDWASPGLGPEVNHPYYQHEALKCCAHCGGGWKHPIHRTPFDERRAAEVNAIQSRLFQEELHRLALDRSIVEREHGGEARRVTVGDICDPGTDY